ncbi:acyl carrier protein-like [Sycon ciliatum]|uniref:acyl carrier protein-like n=1 Tax=Sycon ciliatum TaxID=27933 RepID=UPI0031F65858
MASSSAFRLLSCRSMGLLAAARPITAGLNVCSAARPAQFTAPRCLATSAKRCNISTLSEKDQEDVRSRATSIVKNFQGVNPEKVTDQAKFVDDLMLDSLDVVEIVMAFEDEFDIEISDDELEQAESLSVALDTIALKVAAK